MLYQRLMTREPRSKNGLQAAREGARVAFTERQAYSKALRFYRHLVLYSSNAEERRTAQKKIAIIYYENLADYKQAVTEYFKLLELPHSPAEDFEYRINIAKSYYFLNNFYQSRSEIQQLLKQALTPDQRFETLLLRANIFLAVKAMDEAIETFQQVIRDFPERAKKESVALSLALCFEEQRKFDEAIQTLKSIREQYSAPEFIDLRIKRLQERASYLPGAKGLKK